MGFDQKYEAWPDVAKGIGIILVVIGHVWRGLAEANIPMDAAVFQAVDRGIYLFHMPLFFFVSGWFFPKVMRRGSATGQLGRMILRLLYPMVIWTYLFILVKLAAGGLANDPVSWSELRRLPLPPYLHLWFLWALFVLQVGGTALRLVPDRWTPVLCLALACLALWLASTPTELGWVLRQAVNGAPYFFLAAAMSHRGPLSCPPWCGVAALAILVGLEAMIVPQIHWGGLVWNLLAALCVLCVVVIARHPKMAQQIWLIRLGQASMTIYLTHTIFAAAVRIGLLKAGMTDVGLHLVIGVGVGLGLPFVFENRWVPLGVRRLLGFAPWPIPGFARGALHRAKP